MNSMTTKSPSNLEQAIAFLEEATAEQETLVSQLKMWQDRAENADVLLGNVDAMLLVPKIQEAAEAAGMPPKDWILLKLLEATTPRSQLAVDPRVYEQIAQIAEGYSLSMTEFTLRTEFTEILQSLIENRYI